MSISDSQAQRQRIAKTGDIYFLVSLFCVLFGAVYEYFSHEVYSAYMIYAFAFPLAGGALPFLSLSRFACRKLPDRRSCSLYHCGIATLTLGSIIAGVLEIYGTTNDLLSAYWYVGFGLAAAGVLVYAFAPAPKKQETNNEMPPFLF